MYLVLSHHATGVRYCCKYGHYAQIFASHAVRVPLSLSGTGIMTRAIVSRILPGHSLATCDRCWYDHRNCLLFVLILPRVVPIDGLFPRLVIPGFCLSPDIVRGFNWHPFRPSSVFPISLLRTSVLCPMPGWNPLLFKKAPSPPRHLRMSCCVVF